MACTDVSKDEQNCGSCGNACKGGEFCSAAPKLCACPSPANFLGTDITPSMFDQVINQSVFQIGIGPAIGGTSLNALLIGAQTGQGGTVIDKNYTLTAPSGGGIPSFPLVAALYGVDVSGMAADATYAVTAGTLRFDTLTHTAAPDPVCDELKGTLTNVTFQGATGSLQTGITVDPQGCTFTIPKLAFDIKTGAGC